MVAHVGPVVAHVGPVGAHVGPVANGGRLAYGGTDVHGHQVTHVESLAHGG